MTWFNYHDAIVRGILRKLDALGYLSATAMEVDGGLRPDVIASRPSLIEVYVFEVKTSHDQVRRAIPQVKEYVDALHVPATPVIVLDRDLRSDWLDSAKTRAAAAGVSLMLADAVPPTHAVSLDRRSLWPHADEIGFRRVTKASRVAAA